MKRALLERLSMIFRLGIFEEILKKIYYVVISFLYSVIFAGTVLGVIGLYRKVFVFVIVLLGTPAIYFLILRPRKINIFHTQDVNQHPRIFSADNIVYYLSFILIISLILLPIVRWPESVAGDWFPWDAGKYHFPKAVEMVRSGSANDLTIAYGEYPFGYESLLSFCILLTGDTLLFGWMHALIDVFFILSFWLLACRLTKIKPSTLFFLITLLILSNFLFQIFNLWQVFQYEVITVGKNDLFLAASVLAVLYLYPHPEPDQKTEERLLPIGLVGMIALSIKPNAAFILAPLWIILGLEIIINIAKFGFKPQKQSLLTFIFASLIMVPGVSWLARNIILTRKIFSDEVLVASKWSISANLTNPYFYNYISKNVWLILALLFLMICLSFKNVKYRWITGSFFLLLIGFAFTPVSAFFLRTDVPATINWRFGEAMLAYVFIVILFLLKKGTEKIDWIWKTHSLFSIIRVPIFLIVTITLIWSQSNYLKIKASNKIIIKDQFRDPVGVNGYYSAYDYVQKNVRNSVVWVENGLPFYAYGPGYTNTVSRRTSADYIIMIKTDWFGDGSHQIPRFFDPDNWQKIYSILYEDPEGIVFALKK
jgi:hypothetical protein